MFSQGDLMATEESLAFVEHCRKHKLRMGMAVILEAEGEDSTDEKIAIGLDHMIRMFRLATGVTPLVIPVVTEEVAAAENPRTDLFLKTHRHETLAWIRCDNTDINLLLHQLVGEGDVLTIRKDGTVLHNGVAQPEAAMELM